MKLAQALDDRASFRRFCGFSGTEATRDKSWRGHAGAATSQALALAVEAVNRGDSDILWLSTGPAAQTRAFAQVLATSSLDFRVWLQRVLLLDRVQLHQLVTPHCRMGYKTMDRHCSRTESLHRQQVLPVLPASGQADAR